MGPPPSGATGRTSASGRDASDGAERAWTVVSTRAVQAPAAVGGPGASAVPGASAAPAAPGRTRRTSRARVRARGTRPRLSRPGGPPARPCHDRGRAEPIGPVATSTVSVGLDLVTRLSIASTFNDAADWAAGYGYWAVLLVVAGDGVFPVLPGETAIITAAVLAADGRLNIVLVILAGAVGAFLGDSCAYWIGRAGGAHPPIPGKARRQGAHRGGQRMVARQGPALVFVGRFLPGLRLAVNLSCGAGGMGYFRFAFFDALGAIVWSAQAALLGYFAGKAFADQLWLALLIALGVAALVGGAVALRERRRMRQEREAPESSG